MRNVIFPVIGLVLGTLGGTAFGGLKEKAVLLAEMEAEKAAQEASVEAEPEPSHDSESQVVEEAEAPLDSAAAAPAEDSSEAHTPDPGLASSPQEETSPDQMRRAEADVPAQEETDAGDPAASPLSPGSPSAQDPEASQGEESGTARLAKIFGAMRASAAAKVLQNLDDEEVQAILFHLSTRKAAEILSGFEPARAANLSRAVLGSSGGNGS